MARKVTYWTATVPLVVLSVFAAFTYLSGNPQAVQGFAHVGYPQQLRIILGIAKLLGAIALVVPGIPRVKEWSAAEVTFAWVAAFIAHYLAKDGPRTLTPLVLLAFLARLCVTRPPSRQWYSMNKI